MDAINEAEYLGSIALPVLMVSALADAILVPASHERACGLMPHCRLLQVPDARHELLMERDELRDEFFSAFDEFIEEMLVDRAID
jgi:lysophospholipase